MAGERTIRVLVVDDEPLGRMRIEDLLRRERDAVLIGYAADGASAVQAIRTLQPDLVFLDVQMPGKTGIDVIRDIGAESMPATIFVTAYDQYAIEAFNVAAVDYLVKPFDDERFEQAFDRVRGLLRLKEANRLRERLLAVLQEMPVAPAAPAPAPGRPAPERIAVSSYGKLESVPVADIEYIVARGPYARVHAKGRHYLIRERMQALEDQLDPQRFMRVHRSVIVRLDLVQALHRNARGESEVELKSGVRLKVSRARRESLERWLGAK